MSTDSNTNNTSPERWFDRAIVQFVVREKMPNGHVREITLESEPLVGYENFVEWTQRLPDSIESIQIEQAVKR